MNKSIIFFVCLQVPIRELKLLGHPKIHLTDVNVLKKKRPFTNSSLSKLDLFFFFFFLYFQDSLCQIEAGFFVLIPFRFVLPRNFGFNFMFWQKKSYFAFDCQLINLRSKTKLRRIFFATFFVNLFIQKKPKNDFRSHFDKILLTFLKVVYKVNPRFLGKAIPS